MKMPTEDEAKEHVHAAMRHLVEARRALTIWGFERFIADNIDTLGGAGFVESIGEAMARAANMRRLRK